MTKVYTGGVFDILHEGHLRLLQRAKERGDYLVVGIKSDESVCDVSGKTRPILSTQERVKQMKALPYADEVVVYSATTTPDAIAAVQPDIFVHGDDWLTQADRSRIVSYMEEHGIRMVLLPRTEGVSSSAIRQKVLNYEEVAGREPYSSWVSLFIKKVFSIPIFCIIQRLPLNPNLLTAFSLVLALAAVSALLILHSKPLFVVFSMLTFIFDQLDGTWARAKKQSTEFGKFFDGFTDSVKFFVIDVGLIAFSFEKLIAFFGSTFFTVLFFAAYFALKEFYASSRIGSASSSTVAARRSFGLTGTAARYFIIFPLVVIVADLIPLYFLASAAMHVYKVASFLVKRSRGTSPR